MMSKTSFCNSTLLGKTLRRGWPLWVGYLLLWVLILPVSLRSELAYYHGTQPIIIEIQQCLYQRAELAAPLLTFLISPVAVMVAFSYIYGEKSVGVFAALPVRRETAFWSMTLAGLLPLLAVPVIASAAALAVEASFHAVHLSSLLTFLGVVSLHTVGFYGFAVLCAQLTGHWLALPAVYVVLEFAAVAVKGMVSFLANIFLYGPVYHVDSSILSPLVEIFSNCNAEAHWVGETITHWSFNGWSTVIVYGGVGAVLLLLSLLLYRKRVMETAGDVVAIRPLRAVFKFALGGGCALALACILPEFVGMYYDRDEAAVLPVVILGLALGGFIGYFGAEMLMRKTFRVFTDCWKGFLALLVVAAAFLCFLWFDPCHLETTYPEVEDIDSIWLMTQGFETSIEGTENKEALLALCRELSARKTEIADENRRYVNIRMDCMDGDTRHFEYERVPNWKDAPEIAAALEALLNSEEAMEKRFPTNDLSKELFHETTVSYYTDGGYWHDQHLTAGEVYELYTRCVLPDVADGTLGRVHLTDEKEFDAKCYGASLWLELYLEDKNHNYNAYTSVDVQTNEDSLRTNGFLAEHGIPLAKIPNEGLK